MAKETNNKPIPTPSVGNGTPMHDRYDIKSLTVEQAVRKLITEYYKPNTFAGVKDLFGIVVRREENPNKFSGLNDERAIDEQSRNNNSVRYKVYIYSLHSFISSYVPLANTRINETIIDTLPDVHPNSFTDLKKGDYVLISYRDINSLSGPHIVKRVSEIPSGIIVNYDKTPTGESAKYRFLTPEINKSIRNFLQIKYDKPGIKLGDEYSKIFEYLFYNYNSSNTKSFNSPLGPRYIKGKLGFHRGIDLTYSSKEFGINHPIISISSGVVLTQPSTVGTKAVYIKHPNGEITVYRHMSNVFVSINQKIEAGEIIGLQGKSGAPSGEHLHFEFWPNGLKGSASNPLECLNTFKDLSKNNINNESLRKKNLQKLLDYKNGKYGVIEQPTTQQEPDQKYVPNKQIYEFEEEYREELLDDEEPNINEELEDSLILQQNISENE